MLPQKREKRVRDIEVDHWKELELYCLCIFSPTCFLVLLITASQELHCVAQCLILRTEIELDNKGHFSCEEKWPKKLQNVVDSENKRSTLTSFHQMQKQKWINFFQMNKFHFIEIRYISLYRRHTTLVSEVFVIVLHGRRPDTQH